jgi:hypothetical protein
MANRQAPKPKPKAKPKTITLSAYDAEHVYSWLRDLYWFQTLSDKSSTLWLFSVYSRVVFIGFTGPQAVFLAL